MANLETLRGFQSPIAELDVLWITAGLGCDGDTIAMTAATQPSIEDILQGCRILGLIWHRSQDRPAHNHVRLD